uniref:Transposase n=1 Tax=Panagrellus redivivus TaxID=6233 RepID=A0A7E4ZQS9_PANRE
MPAATIKVALTSDVDYGKSRDEPKTVNQPKTRKRDEQKATRKRQHEKTLRNLNACGTGTVSIKAVLVDVHIRSVAPGHPLNNMPANGLALEVDGARRHQSPRSKHEMPVWQWQRSDSRYKYESKTAQPSVTPSMSPTSP